jgi:poly-gamma-glutamate capsule biosynthesis protein CapA/YwtB (metallophosphatase superfamily)
MIPTPATGPDGGHSLYCLSDSDGDGFDQTLYADFAAAIEAAIETSIATEDLCDPTYVMAVPAGSEISLHQLEQGHVAAIVFRQVVFSPATGQALEPAVKPTPWGELAQRIDELENCDDEVIGGQWRAIDKNKAGVTAQSQRIDKLQDALAQTLQTVNESLVALDLAGIYSGHPPDLASRVTRLEELQTTVEQIACPF